MNLIHMHFWFYIHEYIYILSQYIHTHINKSTNTHTTHPNPNPILIQHLHKQLTFKVEMVSYLSSDCLRPRHWKWLSDKVFVHCGLRLKFQGQDRSIISIQVRACVRLLLLVLLILVVARYIILVMSYSSLRYTHIHHYSITHEHIDIYTEALYTHSNTF